MENKQLIRVALKTRRKRLIFLRWFRERIDRCGIVAREPKRDCRCPAFVLRRVLDTQTRVELPAPESDPRQFPAVPPKSSRRVLGLLTPPGRLPLENCRAGHANNSLLRSRLSSIALLEYEPK
jgi:hypothetical protein